MEKFPIFAENDGLTWLKRGEFFEIFKWVFYSLDI